MLRRFGEAEVISILFFSLLLIHQQRKEFFQRQTYLDWYNQVVKDSLVVRNF